MEEKYKGIVLGGVNVGENDKILNVFTLEKGVISSKIKGVKKAGAKLKFASEPFCFSEYIFSKKGENRTVIGASLIDSFYPIREDLFKYYCAGAVVEFVKHFYKEDMVSENTFLGIIEALKNIAYGDDDAKAILVKFLIDALSSAGFMLSLEGCFTCEKEIDGRIFFDYRNGAFYCEKCFDGVGREVNYDTFLTLRRIKNGQKVSNTDSLVRALRLIDYYLDNRTDERLNSLKEILKLF